ncbi:hypothetical protein [Micromonospora sp. CPCC 206061]|uniref:hypothetical protein n=1 Tax=Micromonospora sp. CPCC 206061 TaxID=3122410 RepID=UPI002FF229EF
MALIAAVAMTATAAPAVAGIKWVTADCFSGTIDSAVIASSGLSLEGRVGCAETGTGGSFGVAHYYSDAVGMYQSTMRSYGPAAPTTFSIGKDVREGTSSFALCVVTGHSARIACVSVARPRPASTTQSGSPIVVTPMATDDPYVTRPVQGIGPDLDSGSSPACGHCW